MSPTTTVTFQNHLLVAMPAMDDPNFAGTVSLVCQHDADGALALVLNRASDTTLGEVMAQMQLDSSDEARKAREVFLGGPVHGERGFILYTADREVGNSWTIDGDLRVSASRDALEDLVKPDGAMRQFKMFLGYAGWGAGQLEQELVDNAWLTVPATRALLFDTDAEHIWQAAVRSLGIDPVLLSGSAGHA